MRYIPLLAQSNYSWLGNGEVVYTTGYKPNTPFADNPALQKLQKPYKDAQAQRRASQASDKAVRLANRKGNRYVSATPQQTKEIKFVNKNLETARQLSKSTPSSPSIIDHNLGLDKTPKSAQESMGVYIKRDIEQALSGKTPVSHGIIDSRLGMDKAVKSAEESASIFAEHGLTQTEQALGKTTKSKGLWGSIKGLFGKAKNAIKTSWSKFAKFAKTPKGKWGIAITAVALVGTFLGASVVNRFSSKNNPTPTNGPDKINMPKVNDPNKVKNKDTDDVDEVDENNKADKTDETKVPATEAEKKEADKAAEANKDKREPDKISGNEYEVVEGDCVWNIAKAHLKELNKDKADYVPSNVEILRHTKELMKINDLHYEADNYVVIIQPGQKIKLK